MTKLRVFFHSPRLFRLYFSSNLFNFYWRKRRRRTRIKDSNTQSLNHTISLSLSPSITMKNRRESIRSLMKLKLFLRKLRRVILLSASRRRSLSDIEVDEEMEAAKMVPDDVKQGHFAVTTVEGEPKRFVLELDILNNPAFSRLLELAEEEYGFQQRGVLAVPCQPEELQMILEARKKSNVKSAGNQLETCKS